MTTKTKAAKRLRTVAYAREFVDMRGCGTGYSLTKRWRLELDCGHVVVRGGAGRLSAPSRAKCPEGC